MFKGGGSGGSSRKRRWDSLIEVAKTGKVGRLISQSRSEDSVCEQKSPNSEDTDSNASDGKAMAALKKKRETFQKSRYQPDDSSSVDVEDKGGGKKGLKRASSVPAQRPTELVPRVDNRTIDDFKDRNGMVMPSLPPGIQPVSGHNIATGWL
jgi:hypothetical protein